MPRKSREREREQLRKESKRQRVEQAEIAEGAQSSPDLVDAPAPAAAPDPAALALATEIAEALGETEDEPRATILRAVVRLGADAALALLQEAQVIEAGGGLWIGDGSRRRTPGGVFFQLLQQRTEKPDRLAIFYPDYQQVAPLTDDELGALLADAATWPRAAPQQVRLRLSGRPSKIPPPDLVPETPYVIFNLESGPAQAPPLSSDLPPVGLTTTYRVLATTAQWRKIAPALVRQPYARIGVVGRPAINPKRRGVITVRATTLKLLVPSADEGRRAEDERETMNDER
ncbi:MAG: phosphorylated adapter RNA export RNA-binding domain-containing protein [Chloroflexota bacterium]|nr:phosphorylated adapter RNA export RNA-binding domain-containing protein [Chloroflexota bacterium]